MSQQNLSLRRLAACLVRELQFVRNTFIVRADVPANRAIPVSSGRIVSSRGIYVRQYFAILFILFPVAAFAAGSSVGYEQGGPYARFEPVVQQYNQSGELFRVDGHCQSGVHALPRHPQRLYRPSGEPSISRPA
jgi:hypothetical protein